MLNEIFLSGLNAHDAGLAIVRIAVGVFFAISGFNKLFHAGRHASLCANLTKNKIPCVWFMQWWVPGWEFVSGIGLALGFLSVFNAVVLLIICLVAFACEAKSRVLAYNPINKADVVCDYLYLQETLYMFMLAVTLLCGPGAYSVDAIIF